MGLVLTKLLLASVALMLALTALVLVRKLRRDKLEWRVVVRRTSMQAALLESDPEELRACLRSARRDADGRVDLLFALDAARPQLTGWHFRRLHDAMASAGLVEALHRAVRARRAPARGHAALLLARARCPGASAWIAPLLRDRDADVRLAAVAALATIGDRAAAESMIAALAAEALPAERIVERIGAPWAVDSILDTLDREWRGVALVAHGRSLRAHLAMALGLAADARGEHALVRLLASSDAEERVAAARALASVPAQAAALALCDGLSDASWQVRAQAARTLGKIGAVEAVPKLERCLGDIAWWVRSNAGDALRALGAPGVAALRRALHDGDRYARDRAREALDLVAVAEAVPA